MNTPISLPDTFRMLGETLALRALIVRILRFHLLFDKILTALNSNERKYSPTSLTLIRRVVHSRNTIVNYIPASCAIFFVCRNAILLLLSIKTE